MTHPSPHLYVAAGTRAGYPADALWKAVARSETISAQGGFPVLSLRHLAHLTGAPYEYLREVVSRSRDPYENIWARKKTGGLRPISAPEPILMDIQRFILHRLLGNLEHHPASYAYHPRRSIVHCAERHLGARWLVKLDLHDFFGQVSERRVYDLFRARGYSSLVAFELARVCTRAPLRDLDVDDGRYERIEAYAGKRPGVLPQGGPTSGALANAAATALDFALSDLALEFGLVYTRYSDDLTFSTSRDLGKSAALELVRKVAYTTLRNGFILHRKKTRIVQPSSRHIVLGLSVDGDAVRLLPEFRRRVEMHVRGAKTFGLRAHAEHRNFRSLLSFINHLDGCIAFAASVEPGWALEQRVAWSDVLVQSGFPLSNR